MIDVMLVLLIIFMIIVPALQSGFKATPPSGSNLKPHPEEDDEQVLGIDETGQYFLNGKPIQNATLGPVLTDIYNKRTIDKVLYVKADKNLKYAKVVDALQVAAESGVRKSAMVTDQAPKTMSRIESDNITPGVIHTGVNP
jgi:biopolymer transport protein ExbD